MANFFHTWLTVQAGAIEFYVTLGDTSVAAFAVETVNPAASNSHAVKLDFNSKHLSKAYFIIGSADAAVYHLLKISPSNLASGATTDVFVKAVQGTTALVCKDGVGNIVAPSPGHAGIGVKIGTIEAGFTSLLPFAVRA